MKQVNEAFVTPALIKWTRETCHFNEVDASKKLGVTLKTLQEWENGTKRPTIPQLYEIAKLYHRPIAVFYLSEVPKDFQPPREFRKLQESEDINNYPNFHFEIRRILDIRQNFLDLKDDLNEVIPTFSPSLSSISDIKEAVNQIREILQITTQDILDCTTTGNLFKMLKRKVELLNIFVLISWSYYRINLSAFRGMAILFDTYPIISINSKDSVEAKIFTLIHELVHLLKGNSDIFSGHDNEDIFCNLVSAEFLMPEEELRAFCKSNHLSNQTMNLEKINGITSYFHVSREAMIYRLNNLSIIDNHTKENIYAKLKESNQKKGKAFGRSSYEDKIKNSYSPIFLNTIYDAYSNNIIDAYDISNILNIKYDFVKKIGSSL